MNDDYQNKLAAALNARQVWLESSQLEIMKNDLHSLKTSFSALYSLYLKKGLITEDPYKGEAKLTDIKIPDTEQFPETERREIMSVRLSNYDDQLDFIVNFYQFTVDFLTINRIKNMVALIKYIEWNSLHAKSTNPNTRAVAAITNAIRTGSDNISTTSINRAISTLSQVTTSIINTLKMISDFNRETYKLHMRQTVTNEYTTTPTLAQIKKKYNELLPGKPFYKEWVEELIREDYGQSAATLQSKVLQTLAVPDEKKPQEVVKAVVPYKTYLVDGVIAIASTVSSFVDIASKLDDNETLLEQKKVSLLTKIKRIIKQMLNQDLGLTIYDLVYADNETGNIIREQFDFTVFRTDLNKKIRNLSAISSRQDAAARLETMSDEQLISFLEKSIKDIKAFHRKLTVLDDYFKKNVDEADRSKIKGIKPELTAIENAFMRANDKYHDYTSQKEEQEQFKRLGIQIE